MQTQAAAGKPGLFLKAKNRLLVSGSPYWHFRRYLSILSRPGSFLRGISYGRKAARELVPAEQSCLQGLLTSGFSDAGPVLDPGLRAELSAEIERRYREKSGLEPENRINPLKNFWNTLISDGDIREAGIFARYALQPSIVNLAAAYLGDRPHLSSIQIYVSRHVPGQEWVESQLWHKDYDDKRIMKLFAYFSDCTEEADGPFTFLKKGPSSAVRNTLFPRRISDSGMLEHVKAADISRALFPKGGAFFIDTAACYHMGSRVAPGRMRIAYVATFTSRFKLYPDLSRIPDFLSMESAAGLRVPRASTQEHAVS